MWSIICSILYVSNFLDPINEFDAKKISQNGGSHTVNKRGCYYFCRKPGLPSSGYFYSDYSCVRQKSIYSTIERHFWKVVKYILTIETTILRFRQLPYWGISWLWRIDWHMRLCIDNSWRCWNWTFYNVIVIGIPSSMLSARCRISESRHRTLSLAEADRCATNKSPPLAL